MIVEEIFYNRQCDCCGCMADEESWHEDKESLSCVSEGWKSLNGKDYCPDCLEWDEDDNIHTKDGYTYSQEGEVIRFGL